MDYCVDCNRPLKDLICTSCKMIYVLRVEEDMCCHNCANDMMVQSRSSPFRYTCNFCLYRYFAYEEYDPSLKTRLDEYISALERDCLDCQNRMTIDPMTQELVCKNCGLVFEHPIYTSLI